MIGLEIESATVISVVIVTIDRLLWHFCHSPAMSEYPRSMKSSVKQHRLFYSPLRNPLPSLCRRKLKLPSFREGKFLCNAETADISGFELPLPPIFCSHSGRLASPKKNGSGSVVLSWVNFWVRASDPGMASWKVDGGQRNILRVILGA